MFSTTIQIRPTYNIKNCAGIRNSIPNPYSRRKFSTNKYSNISRYLKKFLIYFLRTVQNYEQYHKIKIWKAFKGSHTHSFPISFLHIPVQDSQTSSQDTCNHIWESASGRLNTFIFSYIGQESQN